MILKNNNNIKNNNQNIYYTPEFSFNNEYNLLIGKEGVFILNTFKQKEFIVFFLNKWN